ncbi:94de75f0-3e18-4459-bb08-4e759cf6ff09 [Thermothielavioides terrestris]|uniref:94de75f0-3e18-4459-bb08-4e759cf6ff09 n=1 Tax=Thermothielavioides terrestris TaxID=2587410 RepID=A0A446BU30_9PEZI|nr:94de75f0-3e18-4459-bb08-4e759cf6ff09 [Thermothielavioides terrestris]
MSSERLLHGGCLCGRNRYIVEVPHDAAQSAKVVFSSHPSHRSSLATPLPAYLRVPLAWYHSATVPLQADETRAQIRRVWSSLLPLPRTRTRTRSTHPHHAQTDPAAAAAHYYTAQRHFCGFCGTPLAYWSEAPRGEADFIQLALGSLSPRDLVDLEELGVVPGSEGEEGRMKRMMMMIIGVTAAEVIRGTVGAVPWFDALTEGSRLGTLRRAKGKGANRSGTVRVEWEIVEWTEDDAAESPRKRKIEDVEGAVAVGDVEQV